eukprot:366112-Chlamydomonas_euryale.AAC.5
MWLGRVIHLHTALDAAAAALAASDGGEEHTAVYGWGGVQVPRRVHRAQSIKFRRSVRNMRHEHSSRRCKCRRRCCRWTLKGLRSGAWR